MLEGPIQADHALRYLQGTTFGAVGRELVARECSAACLKLSGCTYITLEDAGTMVRGKVISGDITCKYYQVTVASLELRVQENPPDSGVPIQFLYMGDRNLWKLPRTCPTLSIYSPNPVTVSLANGASTVVAAYTASNQVLSVTISDAVPRVRLCLQAL